MRDLQVFFRSIGVSVSDAGFGIVLASLAAFGLATAKEDPFTNKAKNASGEEMLLESRARISL